MLLIKSHGQDWYLQGKLVRWSISPIYSNIYSFVTWNIINTSTYILPAEGNGPPTHTHTPTPSHAIIFYLSSPASVHLHFNQQLSDNPNSQTPETLYLPIYDPRASLPLHCRGETAVVAYSGSPCSHWKLALQLDELCSPASPSWSPNANFVLGLSQILFLFLLLSPTPHPGADKNSSSSNAHRAYKDRNACMHTWHIHWHAHTHNTLS